MSISEEDKRFNDFVESHIASLAWTDEATDYLKTLVIGNIRHFALKVKDFFLADELVRERERIIEEMPFVVAPLILNHSCKDDKTCPQCNGVRLASKATASLISKAAEKNQEK